LSREFVWGDSVLLGEIPVSEATSWSNASMMGLVLATCFGQRGYVWVMYDGCNS
jgi:hypothetical protein